MVSRTKGKTTVQIGIDTREELKNFGIKDDTYEEIILDLMKFRKEHDDHD